MRSKQQLFTLLIIIFLLSACGNVSDQANISSAPGTVIPPTATMAPTQIPPTITPTFTPTPTPDPYFYYQVQSGDTASAISNRFNVEWDDVVGSDDLSADNFLESGVELKIPINIEIPEKMPKLIPDVEFLYSLTALDNDLEEIVASYDGYLNSYTEWFVNYGTLTGVDMVKYISRDNSINPEITLALLQFTGNWIAGQEIAEEYLLYPLGIEEGLQNNLFTQLGLAIDKFVIGYYGWRDGSLTELTFSDGTSMRLDPNLNAGSVGIMYYFSSDHTKAEWEEIIYGDEGYMALYYEWYGDPWENELSTAEHIPADLEQPDLILPFLRKQRWAFTGGPHSAWRKNGPWAGLDFAPAMSEPGCTEPEYQWVLASASGVIARKSLGVIVLDLDGDGNENTGWVLVYLHLDDTDLLKVGDQVEVTDMLGSPSCLGGRTTGIHIHLARKYNGEWMLADGPVPFNLGGWVAQSGELEYDGYLIRGEDVVTANENTTATTIIIREPEEGP